MKLNDTPNNIKIVELKPDNIDLAKQMEALQLTVNSQEKDKEEKHPGIGWPILVEMSDPMLGKSGIFLAALKEKKLVGFYLLTIGRNSLTALDLGVDPNFRGRGIANLLHDEAKKIARREGLQVKLSTVSPHNVASLKPNLNRDGFTVTGWAANKYGPGMHRFYVRGKFQSEKKPVPQRLLERANRVPLERKAITTAVKQRRPFMVPLIEKHDAAGAEAYGHVNWDKYNGTHIHEENGQHYLLLERKR